MKTTFDEWFLAKHNMTFEQMAGPMRMGDALQFLVRQLRDYVTEMTIG